MADDSRVASAPPLIQPAVEGRRGGLWPRLAVTAAFYAVIFWQIDIGSVLVRLSTTRIRYVVAGVVVYGLGQMLSAYRWYLLTTASRLSVPYKRLLHFYFIGMFFNHLLPTIVGGDAVKAILLSRETGSPMQSTATVFMERNLGLFALLAISVVASWSAPATTLKGLSLPAATLLLFLGYLAVNAVLLTSPAYRLVDRLLRLTPLAGLGPRAVSVYDAFARYKRARATMVAGLAISIVFQLIVIVVVFLNTRALGQDVPAAALAVFVPLISLAGMIPVSINGLGVRDALYLLFFGRLGLTADVAVSLAFLYLAVTIVASLPGGVLYAALRKPATDVQNPIANRSAQ